MSGKAEMMVLDEDRISCLEGWPWSDLYIEHGRSIFTAVAGGFSKLVPCKRSPRPCLSGEVGWCRARARGLIPPGETEDLRGN